jgi:hypothetical protein
MVMDLGSEVLGFRSEFRVRNLGFRGFYDRVYGSEFIVSGFSNTHHQSPVTLPSYVLYHQSATPANLSASLPAACPPSNPYPRDVIFRALIDDSPEVPSLNLDTLNS